MRIFCFTWIVDVWSTWCIFLSSQVALFQIEEKNLFQHMDMVKDSHVILLDLKLPGPKEPQKREGVKCFSSFIEIS